MKNQLLFQQIRALVSQFYSNWEYFTIQYPKIYNLLGVGLYIPQTENKIIDRLLFKSVSHKKRANDLKILLFCVRLNIFLKVLFVLSASAIKSIMHDYYNPEKLFFAFILYSLGLTFLFIQPTKRQLNFIETIVEKLKVLEKEKKYIYINTQNFLKKNELLPPVKLENSVEEIDFVEISCHEQEIKISNTIESFKVTKEKAIMEDVKLDYCYRNMLRIEYFRFLAGENVAFVFKKYGRKFKKTELLSSITEKWGGVGNSANKLLVFAKKKNLYKFLKDENNEKFEDKQRQWDNIVEFFDETGEHKARELVKNFIAKKY